MAATGSNPFKAGNADFLQQEKLRSTIGGRLPAGPSRPASAHGGQRAKRREQEVLRMLDRLEDKDTLELGVRHLREMLETLKAPEELTWFLHTVFDDRRPLGSAKARREQLLLLPRVVQHFGTVVTSTGALQSRVLPFLVRALRSPDAEEVVTRAAAEILECCSTLPHDEEAPALDFLDVCSAVLKAFLDPLVLGAGTDLAMKQRCVQVLSGLTPAILGGAEALGGEEGSASDLLEGHATNLMHCLAANPSLQEGLLQCLAQLAASSGRSVLQHAHHLVELCTSHLTETPSITPSYATLQQPSGMPEEPQRIEQPKRGILTRDLALVCCLCLAHVADNAGPCMPEGQSLEQHFSAVEAALGRENLNLQRLTRSNEPLRRTIARAWQAWQDLDGRPRAARSPKRDGSADASQPASGPLRRDRAFAGGERLRGSARAQGPVADGRPHQRCMSPECRRGKHGSHLHRPRPGSERPHSHRRRPPGRRSAQVEDRPPPERHDEPPGHREPSEQADGDQADPDGAVDAASAPVPPSARSDDVDDLEPSQELDDKALDSNSDRHEEAPRMQQLESHQTQRSETRRDAGARPGPREGNPPQRRDSPDGQESEHAADTRASSRRDSASHPHSGASGLPPGGPPPPTRGGAGPMPATAPEFGDQGGGSGSLPMAAAARTRTGMGNTAGPMGGGPAANAPSAGGPPPAAASGSTTGSGPLCGLRSGSGPVPAAEPLVQQQPASGKPAPQPGARPAPALPPKFPEENLLGEVSVPMDLRQPQEDFDSPLPAVEPLPPDSKAPGLTQAMHHAMAGRFGEALQCVFRMGNERTLRAVLERLRPAPVWLRLSEAEARYLAHLLVLLLCKEPLAAAGGQACQWLDALARLPGGPELVDLEDLSELQRALFCRSGAAGEAGRGAARLYCRLSQAQTTVASG